MQNQVFVSNDPRSKGGKTIQGKGFDVELPRLGIRDKTSLILHY